MTRLCYLHIWIAHGSALPSSVLFSSLDGLNFYTQPDDGFVTHAVRFMNYKNSQACNNRYVYPSTSFPSGRHFWFLFYFFGLFPSRFSCLLVSLSPVVSFSTSRTRSDIMIAKGVRFADVEEHIKSPKIDATPTPNNVVHIVVPRYTNYTFPSPTMSTVAFSDFESEYTRTPSTPPSNNMPSITPPSRSPGSLPYTQSITNLEAHPIHPALAAPRPLLIFDVSRPPSLQDLDTVLLSQPASPSAKPVEIYCDGFPWRMFLQSHDPVHRRITVSDILERVHETMQKPVTNNELERARKRGGEVSVQPVRDAHTRRDPNGHQKMKRLDFLLGRNQFMGLEVSDADRNHWRLHVAF